MVTTNVWFLLAHQNDYKLVCTCSPTTKFSDSFNSLSTQQLQEVERRRGVSQPVKFNNRVSILQHYNIKVMVNIVNKLRMYNLYKDIQEDRKKPFISAKVTTEFDLLPFILESLQSLSAAFEMSSSSFGHFFLESA